MLIRDNIYLVIYYLIIPHAVFIIMFINFAIYTFYVAFIICLIALFKILACYNWRGSLVCLLGLQSSVGSISTTLWSMHNLLHYLLPGFRVMVGSLIYCGYLWFAGLNI